MTFTIKNEYRQRIFDDGFSFFFLLLSRPFSELRLSGLYDDDDDYGVLLVIG